MAYLMEQFEKEAAIAAGFVPGNRPIVPEVTTAGIINARLEDDTPIFSKMKVNFRPTDPVNHLQAANNVIILAMKNKVLLRIDLHHADQPLELQLARSLGEKSFQAKIYQIFLDPRGQHLLISTVFTSNSGPYENLYVGPSFQKAQQLAKIKNHVISAVAWNYENTSDSTTDSILLGTTKGLVFETKLTLVDDRSFFSSVPEEYCKQIFDLQLKEEGPITGIEVHRMPGGTGGDKRYFVLITTPSRLYQLKGVVPAGTEAPYLQAIFNSNPNIIDQYNEMPGTLPYSSLQLYSSPGNHQPNRFAWMTEPGVYFGSIVYGQGHDGHGVVTTDTELLSYSPDKVEGKKPLAMVVTEFHILVLFSDRVKAYFTLYSDPEKQLVLDDVFSEMYGVPNLVGMTRDPTKGTIWAFTESSVYRYKVVREDRNVWEAYLNMKKYDLAMSFCKNDAAKLDCVLSKQAEQYFNEKRFEESATLYAKTHNSFEMISLKFLQAEQEDSLKVFLQCKLEGLKPQDKTQITMLVLWLIEIFLTRIGNQRGLSMHQTDEFKKLQSDFHSFLAINRVKECVTLNRSAVYGLIASHGDEDNLIHFASLMKDYERVIQYHLQHKNYSAALDVLTKQNNSELFYQFSPALMQAEPQKTVDVWIAQKNKLNPVRLIPSLVQEDHTKNQLVDSHAVRYLEHCVYSLDSQEEAIHNYLVALYAQQQNEKLMTYLVRQGQDPSVVRYDLKYALRLCSDLNLHTACIHIYSTMGLYEEAVNLALKVDVELAKVNADKPEDNVELRKKLWLKIAQHVVRDEVDVKKAMEFMQECDLIQIEDVLLFFPDFVTIDHFKEAICESLQDYNQHIEGLKTEMEEATHSAQEIRSEVQAFRKKCLMVKSEDKCSICEYSIMSRQFYVFPCSHLFHSDCLISEILLYLPKTKRTRLEELKRLLGNMSTLKDDASSLSSAAPSMTQEQLTIELDDMLASECLYCGDLIIRCVDAPFLEPDELTEAMKGWE